MEENNNAEVIRDLAASALETRDIGDGAKPFVLVPPGYSVEEVENLLQAPLRPRGTVSLRTAQSFIDLVSQIKVSNTRLYAVDDPSAPHFTAIINDHAREFGPGWRDYKVHYACPLSTEWKIWIGFNGKAMRQVEFAKFIEDNLPDIAAPLGASSVTAASLLEVSRSLEAKKNVDFKSATRLSDGAQEFTYNEEVSGTAAKGTLKIPETFDIGIPVFNGGIAYRITARLRYRIDGGKLFMWYDLLREHKVMEDAFAKMREEIEAGTDLKAFIGSI
jgi:uncharacterized protein YfdQ (DUF2303 family)